MRIDDLNRSPLAPATDKSELAAQKSPENTNAASSGTDQAQVSQLAQALAPQNPNRLEQLRLQVQSGKYDVSAEVVANAIIDAHTRE